MLSNLFPWGRLGRCWPVLAGSHCRARCSLAAGSRGGLAGEEGSSPHGEREGAWPPAHSPAMRAAPTSATHVVRRYSRPPCDAPPRCRQRGRGRAQTARREESSCPTPATALLGPEHASARAIARVHASAARVRPERRRTSAAAEEGLHRPHASATVALPCCGCGRALLY